MDPQVIITALIAGAGIVGSETVKAAVKDGYTGLKKMIVSRFKSKADVKKAIKGVEKKPGSEARAAVLTEEIADSGAAEDPEVINAAEKLLELLEAEGITEKKGDTIVINTGSGAAVAGDHNMVVGKGGKVISGDVHGDVHM